jgi:hypothetical protein
MITVMSLSIKPRPPIFSLMVVFSSETDTTCSGRFLKSKSAIFNYGYNYMSSVFGPAAVLGSQAYFPLSTRGGGDPPGRIGGGDLHI